MKLQSVKMGKLLVFLRLQFIQVKPCCKRVPNWISLKTRLWIGTWSDRILETVRILRVERGDYRKVCFFMLSWLIFKCSVDGGMPSLAAAPFDPATFPLLSVRAVSMICFS